MQKSITGFLIIGTLLCQAGCQSSPNRAPEGAAIGGALGAGLGAIIGHQSGETGEGAVVGAGAGALIGALAGSQMQKQPQQSAQQAPQQAAPSGYSQQMTVQQIVDLSRQGISEDVIVDRIRMTNSRFSLSPGDVEYLKGQGVSQKVLSAMQGY